MALGANARGVDFGAQGQDTHRREDIPGTGREGVLGLVRDGRHHPPQSKGIDYTRCNSTIRKQPRRSHVRRPDPEATGHYDDNGRNTRPGRQEEPGANLLSASRPASSCTISTCSGSVS